MNDPKTLQEQLAQDLYRQAAIGGLGRAGQDYSEQLRRVSDQQKPQVVYAPTFDEVLKFIDGLKARGLASFSGLGINLSFRWDDSPTNVKPDQEVSQREVDIGDGLRIPSDLAKDLLGHER
jgi:hypothetical protein